MNIRGRHDAVREESVFPMIIDLHVHTKPLSPCSHIDPLEMVAEAKRRGLDGVCLTEHHALWGRSELDELARQSGIRIFTGNEITTDQGDILVFRYPVHVPDIIPIAELRREVLAAGGFMIAAHPFRGFKVFGFGQLRMTPEQAAKRRLFQLVDAMEVCNGKLSEEENRMALEVSKILGLAGTGGSDAHQIDEVGKWVTVFDRDIRNEQELVDEIRAGRYTIGAAPAAS
ncbi:MAG: metal-dependent phosphoesterase [Deltaproteobacteria bacterium HGW-Deltaproteobacteria-19]|nr:MAG: metal-dependent phosphoesterase [Deltaproteobacteria bacterium HGW-Deltaproteobacteria-19]